MSIAENDPSTLVSGEVRFGNYRLDVPARELNGPEGAINVEPKVFDLLVYLISCRDRVATKDDIIDMIWDGRIISDAALASAVSSARKAVGDDGKSQRVIRTMHGRGFRFVAEVDIIEAGNSPVGQDSPKVTPQVTRQSNLRRRRRPLIGRDREVSEIARHLEPGRIVSIVGPGGVGKTSLAMEIANRNEDQFTGGAWFCELAPVENGQVESAVLGAIDSSAGAGPVNAGTIVDRFGAGPTLLVLDNCEHVIESAAGLAEDLYELAPNLTLLITSREALDIPEEQVFRLTGLSYEDDDATAVQLFQHCASQVAELPNTGGIDETIRQITARLEGLPLAIELAAPRLASSTPEELLNALDDQLTILATRRRRGDTRHSAMDDAIAWSFNLLEPAEQEALTNLSIFSGAFTAQAAEAVCSTANTREILHNLVGQSMVTFMAGAPTSRFRLLEPIRQFAQRQLTETRLAELSERHANWFANRVLGLADQMRTASEIEACQALTTEWSDVGRALAWGRKFQRADVAVEPLVALHIHLLWQLRIEAFGWLEAGVAACDLTPEAQARADLVRSIGAWSMGDMPKSFETMQAAIAGGGETLETAYFQFYQGFAMEDFAMVYDRAVRSYDLAMERDDPAWQITAIAFLICGLAMHKGDAPEIPPLFADLDKRLARLSWPSGRCCHQIAGMVSAFGRGDAATLEECRIGITEAADRCNAPWFKVTAAGIEVLQDRRPEEAWKQLGHYTQNLRSALTSGDVIQLPTILRSAAICLVYVGQMEAAARLSGLIPSVRGLGEKGSLSPGYDDAIAEAKGQLPGEAFGKHVEVGQGWDLETTAVTLEGIMEAHRG